MKKLISVMLALTVAVSAVALSACGSKEKSKTQSSGTSSESSKSLSGSSEVQRPKEASIEEVEVSIDSSKPKITETQLADLNTKISVNQGIPKFTCTSEKLNAREISKDIRVALISKNSSNSYHYHLNDNLERGAERIGFKDIIVAETDGTSSTMNDAINQAVKDKVDLIILSGDINKDLVAGAIEYAQSNGIEVFSAGSRGLEQPDHYVDFTVPINYSFAGELMADWGIVKTGGKIHALVVNCSDSELSPAVFKGFKTEFEQYVSSSDGSCTTINATSIEVGNGLANRIKNVLKNNPKINYVFVFDDSAINDAVSATVQVGVDIKIVATGGSTEDMDYTQSGSIDMLVAQSYEWTAYGMIDYVLRVLGGLSLPAAQDVPFRILTKDTMKKAMDEYSGGYDGFHEIAFGNAFITGYNTLWNYQ